VDKLGWDNHAGHRPQEDSCGRASDRVMGIFAVAATDLKHGSSPPALSWSPSSWPKTCELGPNSYPLWAFRCAVNRRLARTSGRRFDPANRCFGRGASVHGEVLAVNIRETLADIRAAPIFPWPSTALARASSAAGQISDETRWFRS